MIKVSRGRCLLQHWLDQRNLSQTEFARRIGMDTRMISHYCNGTRKMSVEALYAASVILDVPMEQFYEFSFGAE